MITKKLYELVSGDTFEFLSKYNSKQFLIDSVSTTDITFTDIATKEQRKTSNLRKTFRQDVIVIDSKEQLLSKQEHALLLEILENSYKLECEENNNKIKLNEINKLYNKIKHFTTSKS